MSENYQFYAAKMEQLRSYRSAKRPLQSQLDELLAFVKMCEERWNRDSGVTRNTDR